MAKRKVIGSNKIFSKDGYWFTSKSGKHIFVEKNKTMKNYKDEKEQEIEKSRGNLWGKADAGRIGYENLDNIEKANSDYYKNDKKYVAFNADGYGNNKANKGKYLTKEGKFTDDIKDALILKEPYDYKELYDITNKHGIDAWDLENKRVQKLGNVNIDFDKMIKEETGKAEANIESAKELSRYGNYKDYVNAQIDSKQSDKIIAMTKQATEGNRKTNARRAELMEGVSNELSKYYGKNPVKVSDEDVEYDLEKKSNMMKNAYYGAMNKIVERQDALERATQGRIAPRGYSEDWQYSDMLSLGRQVIDDKSKDHWTAKENFAARTVRMAEDNPIKAKEWYGQQRIVANNPDYITVANKENGYDRFTTFTSNGNRSGFYDSYPDVYVGRDRYGDKKDSEYLNAEVNWGSIGSMDTKRAKHEAEKINSAIEHAEAIGKVKTKGVYGRTRDLMDLNEIIKYYQNQGLSPETAKKMANWYIKNRKNK